MSPDRHSSAGAATEHGPRRRNPLRPRAASRRALLTLLAVAGIGVCLAALLLPGAPRATAAAPIASSDPAAGSTVGPNDVASITITFESAVAANTGAVLTCGGNTINTGTVQVSDDARTITVPVTPPLPTGTCTVAVLGAGSPTFRFTVSDNAPTATATDGTVAAGDDGGDSGGSVNVDVGAALSGSDASTGPLWAGRMLSTLGVAVLFGALVLIVAAWPEGPEYVLALRFLRIVWVIAMVGSLLYLAALSALAQGTGLGGGFNPADWLDLLDIGWVGRAALLRVVLVAASIWVVMRPERVIDPTTNLIAVGVPALATITLGLSRTGGELAPLGVLASVVHVLAMAVWLGGVVLLARVVLAGPGEQDLVDAVDGFGRISTAAIIATAVSGIVQLYRVDGGELFTSTHGRIMLLKTAAVAGMLFVGMTARQVARAKLHRASELPPRTAYRLKRAFGTEAAIGLVVLALSGWMLNHPGGRDAGGEGSVSGDDFAQRKPLRFTSENDEALLAEVNLLFEPATVGLNTMRVEVVHPQSGLTGLSVTFTPPADSASSEIIVDLSSITGATVAQTTGAAAINFDVAGGWTITVSGSTANEPFSQATQLDVANDDGNLPSAEIPAGMTTVVTAPPATDPPPTSAATATTAA